jgi:hypothetical protein
MVSLVTARACETGIVMSNGKFCASLAVTFRIPVTTSPIH